MSKQALIKVSLVGKYLGMALIVSSIMMLFSACIALLHKEQEYLMFVYSFAITFIIGFVLVFFNNYQFSHSISIRESIAIILSLWFFVPLFGMLPFYLASPINSIADALFESYAGYTTTGFTNLSKYSSIPRSIIFWRVIIQWLGGMGLMIFIIALFPKVKEGELKIFFSDIQDNTFRPLYNKVTTTARILWFIYLVFTIIGFLALYIAGQNWFDALSFSLSSVSTGGGVPYNGNITHLSIGIKSVIVALMFIAGANYVIVFQIIANKKVLRSEELRIYLVGFLIVATVLIIMQGAKHQFNFEIIFETIFNTVSFLSTTGFYSNAHFDSSILFVWLILFFLMFSGSSTGSSGGGMSVYRLIVLVKTLSHYIKTLIHPHSLIQVKFNKEVVQLKAINRIYAFFVLYIIIFLLGSILLSVFGFDFNNAIGFCVASLSNIGPGVFLLNGNMDLSQIHLGSKVVLIILMVVGRIELFPFLIFFSKTFWRA